MKGYGEIHMERLRSFTRKVYLSYSFNDYDKMEMVRRKLRARGFEIVSDKIELDYDNPLINSIDECDCFILIITDRIDLSLRLEYEAAKKKGKNIFIYIKKNIFHDDIEKEFDGQIVGLWENEDDLVNYIIDDISRYGYSYSQRAYQLELIVKEIFQSYGMTVMSKGDGAGDDNYDILVNKENIKLYIMVKAPRQKVIDTGAVSKVVELAPLLQDSNSKYVLVMANKFSPDAREIIKKRNMIGLDISNLLHIVNNDILKSQLIAILEYSVDDIKPEEPEDLIQLLGKIHFSADEGRITEKAITEKLIKEVQNWIPKEKSSIEYEDLCIRVLKNLFSDDLGLWSDQQRSNEDLYRFDLICKIKDNIQGAFWKFIEEYFRSKYIIFEFKNYAKQITQREIYTTDKYLYAKALRCVAIIISCEGEDKNAKKAVKGTLRENGKLILNISNKDMILMLQGKLQNNSPAEYLYSMLDTMLVELDK